MLKENEVLEPFFGDKTVIQNKNLYRFTSDSILLSRFARAKKGDTVADFCSGSGVVGFHFLCLNPQISSLTLFEMQSELADMSRRTAELNGFKCTVNCVKLQDIGREYDDKFSLILCNPPYESGGFENSDPKRAVCRKEMTLSLAELAAACFKALKFGGRAAVCHRADRAAELIYQFKTKNLEPKRLQFVSGVAGGKPYLVLMEAVKGGKPSLEVLPQGANDKKS